MFSCDNACTINCHGNTLQIIKVWEELVIGEYPKCSDLRTRTPIYTHKRLAIAPPSDTICILLFFLHKFATCDHRFIDNDRECRRTQIYSSKMTKSLVNITIAIPKPFWHSQLVSIVLLPSCLTLVVHCLLRRAQNVQKYFAYYSSMNILDHHIIPPSFVLSGWIIDNLSIQHVYNTYIHLGEEWMDDKCGFILLCFVIHTNT